MIALYPSLSALQQQATISSFITELEPYVAGFHCDIMDNSLVPHTGMTLTDLAAINELTTRPLFVHLMVQYPTSYIAQLPCKENSIIAWHIESDADHRAIITAVHHRGWQAAIAINPTTTIATVIPYLPFLTMVMVMGVTPGKSGQPYIPATTEKIVALHHHITTMQSSCRIAVDGGINRTTIPLVVQAGATALIIGSAIATAPEYQQALQELQAIANR